MGIKFATSLWRMISQSHTTLCQEQVTAGYDSNLVPWQQQRHCVGRKIPSLCLYIPCILAWVHGSSSTPQNDDVSNCVGPCIR